MNIKDGLMGIGGSLGSIILSVVQTTEYLDLISRIASIILSLTTFAFLMWKWYKSASADGKITKEEISEGIDIINDAKDEIEGISKDTGKTENKTEDEK